MRDAARPANYSELPRELQDAWYRDNVERQLGEPTIHFKPTPFVYRDPSKIPRRQFVYGGHLIRGFVSLTTAPAGLGKSSLVLAENVAMATGRNLLGVKPPKLLRTWYINLEDPREEIDRRVAGICLHFGVTAADLDNRLFFDGRETEIVIADQVKTGVRIVKPVEDALAMALLAAEIDVVTIDPFVSTHRVAENDNTAIDAVAKTFASIANKANCAVELVHHVRKTGGAEITAEDGRGASALVAAARSVRVLNPMSRDEGEASGVCDERRFYFRSDTGKANLVPPSTKATWFKLQSVPLHNGTPDAPFETGDHVGVATPWTWPDAFDGVTISDLRKVQDAIANGRWRENAQAKDWAGHAVARVLNLDPTSKAHRAKISSLLKTWIANGMLLVVEGVDAKREKRSFIEVGELAND
jgi:AAA domain